MLKTMTAGIFGFILLEALFLHGEEKEAQVEFNRDIRPIFQDTCFQCHGADAKKAKGDLQLDTLPHATKPNAEGFQAIVPGHPEKSLAWELISSTDAEEVMPPVKSHKTLSGAQKELIRRWIKQGAVYQPHWAYLPPQTRPLPKVKPAAWGDHAIDAWIAAGLNTAGLSPSPEADRASLIRRASLDLTGLAPTPQEVEAFVQDKDPAAYEKLVDRLLASPRYGEERARHWLDLARYGDTHGIHIDNHRAIWPYRDWVIKAFNANQPYDQFSIEQLAGDLLPAPSTDQLVATGYLRCNPTTNEGGVIAEEYQAIYDKDRVMAFSAAWLGVTTGCAACHDHKFDPVSQKDFYRLSAYFRNIDTPVKDGNVANTAPAIRLTDQTQLVSQLENELKTVKDELARLKRSKKDLSSLQQRQKQLEEELAPFPETLIARERPQRASAHVLIRGQYDQKGDQVFAGVPDAFGVPLADKAPENRLGLARWLFEPNHPLTSRVAVNRLWQQMFGRGLVATAADLGTTGERPSHPELLDSLALQFRDSGWNTKALLRSIALSRTYRQSARVTPAAEEKDPNNRLLSHGPRHRLDAEVIRDVALQASGLLVEKLGGPSVKPYQPGGLWEPPSLLVSNTRHYVQDRGESLYRRSLYTYIKRAVPPPAMNTFNATSRESPCATRERTNTPLQALVTLNDPQFVEAARGLAQQCLKRPGSDEERLAFAYQTATSRRADGPRLKIMAAALQRYQAHFAAHQKEAEALIAVGESPRPAGLANDTLAAWILLTSQILNLDETLNN